jgi:hypothetical protein
MKALAVAAVVLLCVSLAYFFFPTVKAADSYDYDFYGVYDEVSGAQTNCTVTAYFSDDDSESFELDASESKSWSSQPIYFHYELGNYDREFWVEAADNNTNLYVFNSSALVAYTITFNDLTNRLSTYQYVEMSKNFNGTDIIVEKRKIDVENKILVSAMYGENYDLDIGGYTYGDLTFGAVTTITLDVKGLEFPDNVLMGYRYVRCYANRDMEDGVIYAYYEDTLDDTDSVTLTIYRQNDTTLVYTTTADSNPWVFSWSGADNSTDYYVTMAIVHNEFGNMGYRQVLPRLFNYDPPWDLSVLGGDSLAFNVNYLIPAFVILAVAGVFSALNTVVGLFATVTVSGIIAYMGWLPIGVEVFIFAFALVIIFAIVMLRRRTYG